MCCLTKSFLQALTVLEFLVKRGSQQCVDNAQNLKSKLEDLQVFEYTSPDGRDHGVNVRHRYPAYTSAACLISHDFCIGCASLTPAHTPSTEHILLGGFGIRQ